MNRYAHSQRQHSGGFASGLLALVVLFAVTVAGVTWVGMGIVASDRWPIRWLEVNGEFQRVSAEQVRASLTAEMNSNFFTVNLGALDEAASTISWVSHVSVHKKWPDTVTVTVEEYEPVAHWNQDRLVSDKGAPFTVPEARELQGLPWLHGPDARLEDVLATWVMFNERLQPLGLEVQQLGIDQRGAWSLVLNNGTQVYLGRNSMDERLARLLSSWDALMEEQEVPPQGIDLRYTNGYAVAWPRDGKEQKGS